MNAAAARLTFFVLALASQPDVNAAGSATTSGRNEVVVRKPPPGPALPYFEEASIEYRVVLSSNIKEAVINTYPGFALWDQSDYFPQSLRTYDFSRYSTPTTVVGDFSGDGKTDTARRLGITSDVRYRIAILYWWDNGQNKFLSSAL